MGVHAQLALASKTAEAATFKSEAVAARAEALVLVRHVWGGFCSLCRSSPSVRVSVCVPPLSRFVCCPQREALAQRKEEGLQNEQRLVKEVDALENRVVVQDLLLKSLKVNTLSFVFNPQF